MSHNLFQRHTSTHSLSTRSLCAALLLATGLGHYDPLFGPSTFDGLPTAPQKVVLVAAEEHINVLWHRVHAIVRSLDQRHVLPEDLSWPEFLQRLEQGGVVNEPAKL